jgi:segregation and condensation protein A
MTYQVDLATFRGPLDLLLYLVKRAEVDICDIPIARVAEQFLEHMQRPGAIDVDSAGDFLVMAATLMEIKSRMLLPRTETEGAEEADPRVELVRQLVEYKKFKDAAALLDIRAEVQRARVPRTPVETYAPDGPQRLQPVELWDLVSAFGRLMRETLALQPRQIVVEETPLQVFMDETVARLAAANRLRFSELFAPPHTRGRLLGYFLALLELTRRFRVRVEQPEPFGELWLILAEEPAPDASTPS